MKVRKINRERRDRWIRMQKTKRNAMPEMDRERFERVCKDPARSRHGAEGLTCPICAPRVHGKLEKLTAESRQTIDEIEKTQAIWR